MSIKSYQEKLEGLHSQYLHYCTDVVQEKKSQRDSKERLGYLTQAQRIAQDVSQRVQQRVHSQIASVVTRCLETVFGKDHCYQFKIEFIQSRGKTEAHLSFIREGNSVDPLGASGGGVVDVAAFALRVACLVLSRPKKRLFLALDEPFRFLSAEYRAKVKALLTQLAEDFDMQILMVTHFKDLEIGKVIELK